MLLDKDNIHLLVFDISGIVSGLKWINQFEKCHPKVHVSWPGNLNPKCTQKLKTSILRTSTFSMSFWSTFMMHSPISSLNTSETWMRRVSSLGEVTNIWRNIITSRVWRSWSSIAFTQTTWSSWLSLSAYPLLDYQFPPPSFSQADPSPLYLTYLARSRQLQHPPTAGPIMRLAQPGLWRCSYHLPITTKWPMCPLSFFLMVTTHTSQMHFARLPSITTSLFLPSL